MTFEYKVVPAPTRGMKAKGLKTSADRFAKALSTVMNEMAADGWEYLRTDTLPSEERQGLTGRTTVFQNMLVFRRAVATQAEVTEAPETEAPETEATETEATEAEAEEASGSKVEAEQHRAPKLPSAAAAQDVPEGTKAPSIESERRDVAAE